jgi:hypothetical protein
MTNDRQMAVYLDPALISIVIKMANWQTCDIEHCRIEAQ